MPILVVILMELKLLMREKLFILISLVFLGLTIAATFIGWSTSNTINHAYTLSTPYLTQAAQLPSNPFEHVSHLSLQRNLSVYIFLVGSLLAIIIGYGATLRDRTSSVGVLTMSRLLTKRQYIGAKAIAVSIILVVLLVLSYTLSIIISSLFPELRLTIDQMIKLGLFYGLSWVYLLYFGLIGLCSGLLAKNQIMALLIPVTLWIIIGFLVPQAISGLEPTALLNPTAIVTNTQLPSIFTTLQSVVGPLSFAENYKITSSVLLEITSSIPQSFSTVGSIFIATGIAGVITWLSAEYYRPSEVIA